MKFFEPFEVETEFSVNDLNLYCNLREFLENLKIQYKYEVVDKTNSHKFIITFTSFSDAVHIENLMYAYNAEKAKEEFERFLKRWGKIKSELSENIQNPLYSKFIREVNNEETLEKFLEEHDYYQRHRTNGNK